LAFALACAMAPGLATAQMPDDVRLRLERQLHLAPTRPERDSAKFLEADRVEAQQGQKVTASGNVILRQRGAVIRADRVDYDGEEQLAVARGNVKLERYGDTASGPLLTYHLDDGTGEMSTPVFEFPRTAERRTASRGVAQRAELGQEQKSRLYQAEYTSCTAPRDDWFLRVHELDVDSSRNVGTAYSSTLYFLHVPILYLPYATFPLDNKRKSGFLSPTFGTSGKSGFEASLPYYWNIAENLDATVTPKIFTKRGLQLGEEFRYLEPKFSGEIDGEFMPRDRIAQDNRWFAGVKHQQQLPWRGWSAAVNAQEVSDNNYFRDLSTKIALTSQTNLPHDAVVAYNDDTWSFSTRALTYQTLQDPTGPPVPIPYRILPQVMLAGARQNVRGFDWSVIAQASNFEHPTLVNGQRFNFYPSVSLPLRRSYGYVTPKVGYYYTTYHLGQNAAGEEDGPVSVPISSVDAGLYFDRPLTWAGRAFEQTLEPRLYYLYIPFRDQSRLPNFTTAEKDFNFTTIFTENRFVGGDRVGDANQITLGLTSRMIESATGLERLTASLGQVYYFTPPKVTLSDAVSQNKNSDILAAITSQMSPSVTIGTGVQYTPSLSRSEKFTLEAHYNPVPGSVINAAYRYARGTTDPRVDPSVQAGIKQVDLSTQWPITRNIQALARWNWSTQDRKLIEGLAGFEYNAGCWQVRAVAHRFITAAQQYSTSFQIQLELTGLSRIGINPLETLRQNIAGYRRSDEILP
jgi:LPS-assembly protein